MKHRIADKRKLDSHHWLVNIELIPENDFERVAIKKAESIEANDSEREFIDNYLLVCLGNSYSFVNLVSQDKNVFIVRVFSN